MSIQHVAALLWARELILDKQTQFICWALPKTDAADEIREQIRQDLGDYYALESYIDDHMAHFPCVLTPAHKNKIWRTRLAWIDAMIGYWKDKP